MKTAIDNWNQSAEAADNPMALACIAMQELQKERALRMAAEQQLEAQRSRVLFADAVRGGEKSILVREMAVILKQSGIAIGETRLFEWLREHGYVRRLPCGQNLPTQKSLEMGIMELKKQVVVNAGGRNKINHTIKITFDGQLYFLDVLTREKNRINAEAAAKKKAKNLKTVEQRRSKRQLANAEA